MTTDLHVLLAKSATARGLLAGAEAAELEALCVPPADHPDPEPFVLHLRQRAAAARRRYFREVAAVQRLIGQPWPEAEALGVEP